MLKIRRPLGRLIFNMGIAIPGKTVFLIETAPWSLPYAGFMLSSEYCYVMWLIDFVYVCLQFACMYCWICLRTKKCINTSRPRKKDYDQNQLVSNNKTQQSIAICLIYGMYCVMQGLTHWGRVTHICVNKLNSIGSDNGLSPGWCQAIIWTKAGILSMCTSGTNFSETLSEMSYIFIHENSIENIIWEIMAILSQPQYVKLS